MQYTGLKDKNGKEIYEGDITTDGDMICRVEYDVPVFTLKSISNGNDYNPFYENLEVIGNIYENPELLN